MSDHEEYETLFTNSLHWLNDVLRRLATCADVTGDKEAIEDKQIKIQELLVEKEQGGADIHRTIESGERLYPSTSAEGREIIRQQLRLLREKWEGFSDQTSETQRKLEVCLHQWSSYDDSFEQLQSWITEATAQLNRDSELHGSLPEKKVQLQAQKVSTVFPIISVLNWGLHAPNHVRIVFLWISVTTCKA